MFTQKQIIEVARNNNMVTKNANDAFQIIKEFEALDRSLNYNFRFQKTRQYWSDAEWRQVAKDIQNQMKIYKSK